ncbi:hypothetical protein WDJ51_12025 [Rathayibacter sp. YIM 133350]|uniref:hypothetical protein n=1 Tax=Rathayibacter sp. YIM 133350 TaxID=3131992 RepID=UPI00307E8D1E
MRWPWQRNEPTRHPSHSPTDAAPSAPAPAGWAFLPPLQREVDRTPPRAMPATFLDRLPTRVNPTFLGTMGHLLDPSAPAGTVARDEAALSLPVQRAEPAEFPLHAPREDRAVGGRGRVTAQRVEAGASPLVNEGTPLLDAAVDGAPFEAAVDSSASEPSAAMGASAMPGAPVQRSPQRSTLGATDASGPSVARPDAGAHATPAAAKPTSTPAEGASMPLPHPEPTAAPSSSSAAPAVQRVSAASAAASTGGAGASSAAVGSPPSGNAATAPAPEAAAPTTTPPTPRAAAPTLGTADAPAGAHVQRQAGTAPSAPASPPRRLGLGAPLPTSTSASPGRSALPVQRSADQSAASGSTSSHSSRSPASPTWTPSLPSTAAAPSFASPHPADPTAQDAGLLLPTLSRGSGSDLQQGLLGERALEPALGAEPSESDDSPASPSSIGQALPPLVQRFVDEAGAHVLPVGAIPGSSAGGSPLAAAGPSNAPTGTSMTLAAGGGTAGFLGRSSLPAVQRSTEGGTRTARPSVPLLVALAPSLGAPLGVPPARASVQRTSAAPGTSGHSTSSQTVSARVLVPQPTLPDAAGARADHVVSTTVEPSESVAMPTVQRQESAPSTAPSSGAPRGGAMPVAVPAPRTVVASAEAEPATAAVREIVVQRAEEPGDGEASAPSAPAPSAAAGTASTAPAAAASSPEELEKLAARLYAPLVRRIKSEMLLDRERRGVRIDGL